MATNEDDEEGSAKPMAATSVSARDVHVDRDSVAAGDDIDSHARRFTFPCDLAIEEVIERLVESGYLPTVSGGATWSVTSGVPIAVIAQGGPSKRVSWQPVDATKLQRQDGVIGLYFNYHTQHKPEVVLAILRRLRLNPFS